MATLSNTAAYVVSNLDTLENLASSGQLTSITLTDSTKPTLTVSVEQLFDDADALNEIVSPYNLAIRDTADNVGWALDTLETLAATGKLTSIILTDSATPVFYLTAAQFSGDSIALNKVSSPYDVSVTDVSAANAASVAANSHVVSLTVLDSAAHVVANFSALTTLANGTKLGSISLTDSGTPTLVLTVAQAENGAMTLYDILGSYKVAISDTAANVAAHLDALEDLMASDLPFLSITLSDSVKPTLTLTVDQLFNDADALNKITSPYNMVIRDTADNVGWGMDTLEALAASGKLTSVILTDSTKPIFYLTASQFVGDSIVLSKVSSPYDVSVTDVSAANAASVAASSHVISLTVLDSVANISANFNGLAALANGTKLGSISLTNSGTPVLVLTAAQAANDVSALYDVLGNYTIAVRDTAANVAANLDGLENTWASDLPLASITLTDSVKPTLTLTVEQLFDDADALNKIVSSYNMVIRDTADNVGWALDTLESFAVSGKLTLITLTDSGTSTLYLTAAQLISDAAALGKIKSAFYVSDSVNLYGYSISAAQAASVASQVKALTITDSAANVVANIAVLETLATSAKLTSIFLTDSTKPTLALTAAQLSSDSAVLGKITSAYSESILGVTAANAANIAAGTHVTSLSVSDTAANVLANLTALETLATGTKLASIVLTNSPTPTLSITAAQSVNDAAALNKITSTHNTSISGGSGNDTLMAGTGNTTMAGGGGTDSYVFGASFGQDTINNLGSTGTTAHGQVKFGTGITDEKLWFQKSGNNLQIDLLGTTHSITISNWYGANASAKVTAFNTSDGLKIDSQITQLVSAMASYSATHASFNPTTATQMPTDTTLQAAITAAWHS